MSNDTDSCRSIDQPGREKAAYNHQMRWGSDAVYRKQIGALIRNGSDKMKQVEDFSVTWDEVIEIVDKLVDRNEPMSMGEIESAVRKAWIIIFDNRCKKYGLKFDSD